MVWESKSHDIFICYAKEDRIDALKLTEDLEKAGLNVWIDVKDLKLGQKWKPTIIKAIETSKWFIALLSTSSVSKRGFVQKEIRIALDILGEMPEDRPFLIPARLEECEPSHLELRELQWANLFEDWDRGVKKILQTCIHVDKTKANKQKMEVNIYIKLNAKANFEAISSKLAKIGVERIFAVFGVWDLSIFASVSNPDELYIKIDKIRALEGVMMTHSTLVSQQIIPSAQYG